MNGNVINQIGNNFEFCAPTKISKALEVFSIVSKFSEILRPNTILLDSSDAKLKEITEEFVRLSIVSASCSEKQACIRQIIKNTLTMRKCWITQQANNGVDNICFFQIFLEVFIKHFYVYWKSSEYINNRNTFRCFTQARLSKMDQTITFCMLSSDIINTTTKRKIVILKLKLKHIRPSVTRISQNIYLSFHALTLYSWTQTVCKLQESIG